MPKLNQAGITQALILFILIGGIIAGVWLVTAGPLKLFPKADEVDGKPLSWATQYCQVFVNTSVCGQDTFDNCSASCDGKQAIYNCQPTDRDGQVCSGKIYCERENNRCNNNPCPSGTSQTTDANGTLVCVDVVDAAPNETAVPADNEVNSY